MTQYTTEDLEKIVNSVSLVDYFYYLQTQGQVKFDRKYGKDYYFITDNNKYSVTDDRFYDFKSGTGGQTIKAVMELENKSWKEAVDFLKEFNNVAIDRDLQNKIEKEKKSIINKSKGTTKIVRSIIPNNRKLIDYFIQDRGISKEVLKANTRQIHYEVNGKQYFGIGLKNQSGGYEVRNPMMKSKIGKNNFSVIEGSDKSKMFVFEGMTDMLSFLQLLKDNNRESNHTLVCLNSVTNIDKFTEKNKNYNGKVYLILDGDEAGNKATQKILDVFKDKNVKDVRISYNIQLGGNNDLNDYLKKKRLRIENNSNLANKNINNGNITNKTQRERIPNSQQMGTGTSKQHVNTISSESQSEQVDRGNNTRGQDLFGTDVRNGLTGTGKLNAGSRRETEDKRGAASNRTRTLENAGSRRAAPLKITTNLKELDHLIQKYKGQKLTNEQVAELVSVACFVDENKVVQLNSNLNITDDLKELVNQYKTGGIAKKGRGVLDEYYTNIEIVDTVKKLIDRELNSKENLSVLEPSVGIGNFLNAVTHLPNAKFKAFEINEITAKVSKILYPETDVNLRPFETEFIDDYGLKKEKNTFSEQYDLVIGNPPYGDHRGFYKGLGEEPKLSRYEDYFVKRSLDSLKENGTLAMVLPSGWLNRQKKLNNAELVNAYRLPIGAFAGTQVGTDIVLLKKNNQKQNIDISNFFKENPNKVLGEIREKTNRFGRLEAYVYGNLKEALSIIERDNLQKAKGVEIADSPKKEKWKQQKKEDNQPTLFDDIEQSGSLKYLKQYKEFKRKNSNTLFLFEVDGYYESYEEDAKVLAEKLKLDLKQDNNNSLFVKFSRFKLDVYLQKLKQQVGVSIGVVTELKNKREIAITKTQIALNALNKIKFQTPAVIKEVEKYKGINAKLVDSENVFEDEELSDIIKKADRIINSRKNKKGKSEYEIQSKPKIKQGILKYQFSKSDEIVNTSIQNSSKLSKAQIKAFEDTDYDGTIRNRGEHFEYSNYIDEKWVHDFYYAEGNIYAKLKQLENDKHIVDKTQAELGDKAINLQTFVSIICLLKIVLMYLCYKSYKQNNHDI